jgi:small subunit ribosomal protein S7
MPRRTRPERREALPDARYGSRNLQILINKIMRDGKKSVAERVVYGALGQIEDQTHKSPVDVFDQALRNVMPVLEVKPRRVGGATYQVPIDIRAERRLSLALRWLIQYARARRGPSMSHRLAAELIDAANGQGASIKRKEDTHRMAEANRAFVHYRW